MTTDGRIVRRAVGHGLVGKGAHAPAHQVFDGMAWKLAGVRPTGAPHSLYQLVNHMSYWQDWAVRWLDGSAPPTPKRAAASWPGTAAPASRAEWTTAVRRFKTGVAALERRAREAELLSAGRGKKTPLEMLQIIGAHNSYHAGQAAFLRQMLGAWPPPSGGLTW